MPSIRFSIKTKLQAISGEAVGTIERLSGENTAGFGEMAAGIAEMSQAATALSHLGQANSANVTMMEEELGRFHVTGDGEAGGSES